jgi:hypothetical protein
VDVGDRALDTGVVDEDVDAAIALDGLTDDRVAVGRPGHVGWHECRPVAVIAHLLLEFLPELLAAAGRHDVRALRCPDTC